MDPWFKIVVNGECWVAQYRNAGNAAFGGIRKLRAENEKVLTVTVYELPPKPWGMAMARYTRELRAEHNSV